jgi:hypothetical protein
MLEVAYAMAETLLVFAINFLVIGAGILLFRALR